MDEEQRDGTHDGTPLVYIVHVQLAELINRDGAREHGERIQFALVRAPFIPVPPPAKEPPDISEWYTVGPFGCFNLVRQAGVVEFAIE